MLRTALFVFVNSGEKGGGGSLCAPYDYPRIYSLKLAIKLMWSYVSIRTCLLLLLYDWKKISLF